MTTITMTREMGSLGNRVAQEVAKRLGLRLVYQEIVRNVADRMRMKASAVGRFVEGESNAVERFFVDSRSMGLCTAEEVLELALEGDVIIRGWGASHVLKSVQHAVHVRVHAPMERRVANMVSRMEQLNPMKWAGEIAASDRQHSAVLERMFGANGWQDPKHYHLVLDTSELSVEDCVERVIESCQAPEFQETESSRQQLADTLLAARIQRTLQERSNGHDLRLDVRANDGNVTLAGIVSSTRGHDLVQEIVRATPGVREVSGNVKVIREAANYMSE